MSDQDIDKAYISPYDRFMFEFDATHEKSASQLKEIKKFQKIFEKRDNVVPKDDSNKVWSDF